MSEAIDLSALDGNDLVARLAVVKVRALEDSRASGVGLYPNDVGDPQKLAQRADTEAVLDECAVRLLNHEIQGIAARWQRNAENAMAGTAVALAEVERLRGLIHAVVAHVSREQCPVCAAQVGRQHHLEGCPWPVLVGAAEKS
jgi:hypothetical protein